MELHQRRTVWTLPNLPGTSPLGTGAHPTPEGAQQMTETPTIPTSSRAVAEPSAWLRSASRRRVIGLSRHHATESPLLGTTVVVAFLTHGEVEPGSREDRTCDRCGRHCPPGTPYGVSAYLTDYRERRYFIVFGLCLPCGQLEQPGDRRCA